MSTNINFVNSEGLESDTRIDFNLPRTILLKSQGRAVADGAVIEGELCAYNALNALSKIIVPTFAADPATLAYLAATGITGATEVAAINNLVVGLKADGLWSKMKAVYPFVTDNRNLLGYTEDFSNIYWNKTGGSAIVSNTTTAPNGTLTADTFITASGSMTNRMVSSTLDIIGQTVCVSIYAKSDTFNRIRLSNNISNVISADFNLDTGTLVGTTGSVISTSVSSVGNGWYRCSMSYVATDATVVYRMPLITSGISSSIFVWGAQLELGSTATTYQPIATTQQAYISNQFKYNLKDPRDLDAAFRLVFNGGWTFSTNGALPNGTNGFADTKLVPSSVLSLNSTHLSYYSRTNVIAAQVDMGTDQSNASCYLLYSFNGVAFKGINRGQSAIGSTYTPTNGLLIGNRPNSTTEIYYHKGTLIDNLTVNSNTLSTNNLYLGAYNSGGIGLLFSTKQTAFATIGDGLLDSEATALYNRVQNFQTALSRNV